jgi:RHS repeat-associated protein
MKSTFFTAIGRSIQAVTYRSKGVPQERTSLAYDVLGHMTSMTRYQNPMPLSSSDPSAGFNPVTTTLHYDSLGQVLEFDEPDSAAQFRSYNNWGQLTQVQWCDTITSPCTDRRTITKYDALERVSHREDNINNVVDAETVNDYTYDQPAAFVNRVTPTNVRGRLASASWPTGRVSFSYDGFGRVDARGFDNKHGNTYIEKHTYHSDGLPSELHLLLPDNNFKDERVDYIYDSASRLRSAKFSDGTGSVALPLFNLDTIDPFGRIREARVGLPAFNGPASYSASYADTGRRLLQDVKVTSATGAASREISYPAIPGMFVTAYDPMGRERVRREVKNGTPEPAKFSLYDALGRFEFDSNEGFAGKTRQFSYDPLGNLLTQTDFSSSPTSGSVTLSYQSTDRDRICSIGYGSAVPSTTCDVKYDGLGNIIEQKSRSNGTRKFDYFANGQVKKIADESGNVANFRYDAFGAVHKLELTGNTPDTRHDRHFGGLIAVRDETISGSTTTSIITRTIPGPGFSATRHGPAGPWIFTLGEGRGSRFFIEAGDFVQDVSYAPYGEATSTGQPPHFAAYSSEQWNGGDWLSALGLSQLGARIYDPVIGRFLSRDLLLIPRTAGTTNPYAFAMNDPVNSFDPTGLDNGGECYICSPTPFDPLPGGLPGFRGGPPYVPSDAGSKLSGPVNGPVVPVPATGQTYNFTYRDYWNDPWANTWANTTPRKSYEHLKRGPLGLVKAVTDFAIDTIADTFVHDLEGTGFNSADAEYVKPYIVGTLNLAMIAEGGYGLARSLGLGGAAMKAVRAIGGSERSIAAATETEAALSIAYKPVGLTGHVKIGITTVGKNTQWSELVASEEFHLLSEDTLKQSGQLTFGTRPAWIETKDFISSQYEITTIGITESQASAAWAEVQAIQRNPGTYGIVLNSCTTFCRSVMRAAGQEPAWWAQTPRLLFKSIR